MMQGPSLFFFDREALLELATRRAAEYQGATPFPHVVIDDFLPTEVAETCEHDFPAKDGFDWDLYTDGGRTLKLATSNEAIMPPRIRQIVGQFNSVAMIEFLEKLTGIPGLIPDPHLVGGGLHRIEQGGFLEIHADFNQHGLLKLDRRLNLLLYLNPGWKEEWGGHLELWDQSMKVCQRRISPLFNRCVIFSTTDTSFHGHPKPLECPPDIARRSLAFYYYSNGRPESERSDPHSTLYQTGKYDEAGEDLLARRAGRLRHAIARRAPARLRLAIRSLEQRARTATRRDPA